MSQYYGQKNFLQKIGVIGERNYRIEQTGCLLVTIANWLKWKKGIDVSPLVLNQWFIDHNLYIDAPPKDGILDDLSWNSLTQYDPTVMIANAGGYSPSMDGSFVKFEYNSVQTGNPTTHFCLMIDAANGVIIDAWDGLVKNRDQYEHVYGKPVAYCTYLDDEPVQVIPTRADNHPSTAYQSGKKLFLPAAAGLWRVYPLDKTPVIGNEVGKLAPGNPAFAPGLTYDILGTTGWANVFTINTGSFGKVNIYAGPDTIAQFVDAVPEPSAVAAPAAQAEPAPAPVETPAPVPAVEESPAETVPVKVIPSDPEKWKKTYQDYLHPQVFTATQSIVIRDLSGSNEPTQLVKGQEYTIAGEFTGPDNNVYCLSLNSRKAGIWYSIPKSALRKQSIKEDDELFAKLIAADKAEAAINAIKKSPVSAGKKAGTFAGLIASLFVKLKIIKPKGIK